VGIDHKGRETMTYDSVLKMTGNKYFDEVAYGEE
jgi:hypothetical protein